MYSQQDLQRNFLPAFGKAIGLTALLVLLILILEDWDFRRASHGSPIQIAGFVIGVPLFLTIAVLAWQSAFSMTHAGWRRILLLVSAAVFLAALLIELAPFDRTGLHDVVEGLVGSVVLSSLVVVIPQMIFALYRWIMSGFDEARDSGEPLDT